MEKLAANGPKEPTYVVRLQANIHLAAAFWPCFQSSVNPIVPRSPLGHPVMAIGISQTYVSPSELVAAALPCFESRHFLSSAAAPLQPPLCVTDRGGHNVKNATDATKR